MTYESAATYVDKIGAFRVPPEPESRHHDSLITAHGICGRYEPELAKRLGEWGDRCGQEYSYLWRRQVEDVRVVLDIGANIGAFAVWAARIWWPDQLEHVHCYEPNDALHEYLEANVRLLPKKTGCTVHKVAVTTDPDPIFHEHDQSGRSHTWGKRYLEDRDGPGWRPGRLVPSLHPRGFPPADAIKTDAEGVDAEIFEHYQHWSRIKVAMFEWHTHEHRIDMFRICEQAGLLLRKNDCGESEQGVACWVRP